MKIKKITLVQHTHTDIGYTTNYPEIAVRHIRHLRDALGECRKDPRFRWTVESGWAVEQFFSVATRDEKNEFMEYLNRGQIEMTALYTQPLTQVCNLEELCACIERNYRLLGGWSKPIRTAMINDMGGLSYNFPQILSQYGVKYVVNGCGGWRVMLPFTILPHIFYLAGPDGSKIMFYQLGDDRENRCPDFGPAQYGFGEIYFLWPVQKEIGIRNELMGDDGEKSILRLRGREGIDALLARLHRDNYPCDTLLMQLASDNFGTWDGILEIIDHWNAKYGEPKIELGTCEGFFNDIERRYSRTLQTIQGELTCSWSEHVLTNASATGTYRDSKRRLQDWGSIEICKQNTFAATTSNWWKIMDNLLLYSDHTCGISMWKWDEKVESYGSFWDDAFDLPREAWKINADYATEADRYVRKLLNRQTIELSTDDPDNPEYITIFNPSSFAVSSMASFVSTKTSIQLTDENGSKIPVDSRAINTQLFQHKACFESIPPYGTAMFSISEEKTFTPPRYICDGWQLRGPKMIIDVDLKTGGINSAVNVPDNTQWIDTSEYTLNEVVYYNVGNLDQTPIFGGLNESLKMNRAKILGVRKLASSNGYHLASMMLEIRLCSEEGEFAVETQYVLNNSGLSIRNFIRKLPTLKREACYFAFPLHLEKSFHFDVEQQGQTTRFPEERLPGSSNHNLAVQDFVAVSDSSRYALLTTFQACVISLGQPNHYRYDLNYSHIDKPTVLFYAFNNLWNTNCPLRQTGELVFEYHVAFKDEAFTPAAAYKLSKSVTHPPIVISGNLEKHGFRRNKSNLLTCSADNVIVDSIKPLGDGVWQVRLIEVNRQPTQAVLQFASKYFNEYAVPENYLTQPKWNKAKDDRLTLSFHPAEMKTLLLREQ